MYRTVYQKKKALGQAYTIPAEKVYLRTQYKGKLGKPLSPKSLRHQYGTLNLIFGYAEKQEMIVKNPMRKA